MPASERQAGSGGGGENSGGIYLTDSLSKNVHKVAMQTEYIQYVRIFHKDIK